MRHFHFVALTWPNAFLVEVQEVEIARTGSAVVDYNCKIFIFVYFFSFLQREFMNTFAVLKGLAGDHGAEGAAFDHCGIVGAADASLNQTRSVAI